MRAVAGVGAALFGLPLVPPPLLWPHKTKWRLVVSPPFGTEGKEGGLEVHYRGKGGGKGEGSGVGARLFPDYFGFESSLIYVLVFDSVLYCFLLLFFCEEITTVMKRDRVSERNTDRPL